MRKIVYILIGFASLLILVSCKPSDDLTPIDLEVTILSEVVSNQVIDVHVLIPIDLADLDELMEITLHMATLTYNKHFEDIKTDAFELNIHLYASSSDYQANTQTYGYHQFFINQTLTTPGLSLGTNGLKLT